MWNNLWLNNIYIYFNDKILSNLNRKVLKCIIYINFFSASNNCLVLKNKLWYITDYEKWFILYYFSIYFNTCVSLKGTHITWMLFVLHAPYSKFCKDGLILVSWPKYVIEIKIKYIVMFDWNQKLICWGSLINGQFVCITYFIPLLNKFGWMTKAINFMTDKKVLFGAVVHFNTTVWLK